MTTKRTKKRPIWIPVLRKGRQQINEKGLCHPLPRLPENWVSLQTGSSSCSSWKRTLHARLCRYPKTYSWRCSNAHPPPLILLLNCSGGIILKMKIKGKQRTPGFPKFPSCFSLFALVNSDFLIKIPFPALRLLHNRGMFAGSEPFICLVVWLWDGRRISCVCLCVFPFTVCIKSLFTPAMTQKLNLCTLLWGLLLVSFPHFF